MNANVHGICTSSRESDVILYEARFAATDFLSVSRPEEIVFGLYMASLNFSSEPFAGPLAVSQRRNCSYTLQL